MPDEIARDQTQGIALATVTVLAHLLRIFVSRGILTDQRIFDLLHEVEMDLAGLGTIPGAVGAGHVNHIRRVFQTPPQNPPGLPASTP